MNVRFAASVAPLFLRLGLGLIFIVHGLQKWMDLQGTAGFFRMIGLPAPDATAGVIAFVELAGGLAVLFGIFTRFASALLAAVMVGAIATVKLGKGFVGGYEFDLMVLLAALSLACSGAGAWSLDALTGKDRPRGASVDSSKAGA